MSTDRIRRDIIINASCETVYDVVSRPEHVSQWFSDDAEFEPVAGSHGRLLWRDENNETTSTVEITIVTTDRPRLFAFRWVSPERLRADATATDTVLVEFRITETADGTHLEVSESGLDSVSWDDDARAAYAADHTNGWGKFLAKISEYAEDFAHDKAS